MNICVYCGTVHPPIEGQWRTQWVCVGAVERRNGDFKYFQVFCNLICSKCSVINLKIMSKAHISLGLQRERAPRSEFIPSPCPAGAGPYPTGDALAAGTHRGWSLMGPAQPTPNARNAGTQLGTRWGMARGTAAGGGVAGAPEGRRHCPRAGTGAFPTAPQAPPAQNIAKASISACKHIK